MTISGRSATVRLHVGGAGLRPAGALISARSLLAVKEGAHGGTLVPPCSNICRCTGYVNIVEAIRAASK